MRAWAALLCGAAVTWMIWSVLRPWATARSTRWSVLRRRNYRGSEVIGAAGVVIVLAVLVIGGGFMAWSWLSGRGEGLGPGGPGTTAVLRVLGVTIGFGALGLIDDLAGDRIGQPNDPARVSGFGGHLGAARRGQMTTGLVKVIGGAVVGLLVAPTGDGAVAWLRAAVLIAGSANLGNLFDRAPGRAIKVGGLAAAAVMAFGGLGWNVSGPLVVLGAGLGLLGADLHEQCMLGDTGANVLGAAAGLGLVVALGGVGQWLALAVVVAGNVASECVSFSAVIDRSRPLRWVDRWGCLAVRRTS